MKPENQILANLSGDVFQRLAPHLVHVTLEQGKIIYVPGEPLSHIYFPLDCLLSLTITMENGATSEVGMIGSRELFCINAFMGRKETTQTGCCAQVAGSAIKIDAQVVRQEFDRNGELRDLLLRSTQAFLAQVSQTAACNSLHVLEKRLARWLLNTQERIDSKSLPLTQEFIATMLGVRRAGVTQAAQKLQEQKLIQYHRGHVQILDQAGLEAYSCECFQTIKTEYDRLLGEK